MKKDQLSGFRPPSIYEQQVIPGIILKDLNTNHRFRTFWIIFIAIIFLASLINIPVYLLSDRSGEAVIAAGLAIITLIILIPLWSASTNYRMLRAKMMNGFFEVLDCKVSEVSIEKGNDWLHKVGVKIYTSAGETCDEWILTDRENCSDTDACRNDQYLLVRCRQRKDFFYKLVSGEMMNHTSGK